MIDEGYDVGGSLLADRDGIGAAAELRRHAVEAGVELLAPAIAIGLFEQGLVPVAYGNLLLKFRAHRVVVASGIVEQPLVFPGNDLVGVMLPGRRRAASSTASRSSPPSARSCSRSTTAASQAAADLEAAGVEIARVVDFREDGSPAIEAHGKGGKVAQVSIDGHHVKADLVVMCRQPAAELQAARPGRRARRVRRGPRRLRPDRPAGRRRGGRRRHRRRRRAGRAEPDPRPPRRQVLRLLLRGPDDEGPEVRDRRGLRLDRALEALHDGDDGAVPGPALPHELDPRLREDDRDRREHDRHDDGPAAVHADLDGPARRPAAGAAQAHRRCTTATRTWAAR